MLHPDLLAAFMSGHFGYGNLAAPLWFVGMEEAGGRSVEEIERRLTTWASLGRQLVTDVRDYHLALGVDRYWSERPPLQRTWGCLCRVLLVSKGLPTTTEHVRMYQRDRLARADGESCLVELMPLPSPNVGQWLYGTLSDDHALATRESYMARVRPARVARLRELIHAHRPRAVVFYGASYTQHWNEIAGVDLVEDAEGIPAGRVAETLFCVTRHPAAHGTGSAYFERVGAMLRDARPTARP